MTTKRQHYRFRRALISGDYSFGARNSDASRSMLLPCPLSWFTVRRACDVLAANAALDECQEDNRLAAAARSRALQRAGVAPHAADRDQDNDDDDDDDAVPTARMPFEHDRHLMAWQADTMQLGFTVRAAQWRAAFRDIAQPGVSPYGQQLRWLLMHKRAPCGRTVSKFDRAVTSFCPWCGDDVLDDCRHAYVTCPASQAVWRWLQRVVVAMGAAELDLSVANIVSGFTLLPPRFSSRSLTSPPGDSG